MLSKKKRLENCRLYVIIDKKVAEKRSLSDIARKLKKGPADIIQLRDKETNKSHVLKDTGKLSKALAKSRSLFIVNDYVDIAKVIDCDGVHLGQEDLPIKLARMILGKHKIIGISCFNLRQAIEAEKQGADYIGIGPAFLTTTKPEARKKINLKIIKEINKKINIPCFVIGGINQNNIEKLISCGARRAAISSAVITAKDIAGAVKYFKRVLH